MKVRILDYIGFLIALFLVCLLWNNPVILFFLLLFIGFLLVVIHRSIVVLLYFIFIGFLGGISEIIAIHFGAWQYTVSQFLGIPFWLLPLWGIAGIAFYRIKGDLEKLKYKLKNIKFSFL